MTYDPMRIHLSLVSHTNIGKTTLARTLLSRDIGEVADRAHVTETTDDYVLARSPEGGELILWDTPGFGNSVALVKRLEGRSNPVGWFLAEVWDRVANKTLWLNQKAIKHVREISNVVLYLVNATELPDTAPYVTAEMKILEWIGKPVIVLLNQMGKPKSPEAEQADVGRWKNAMASYPIVSDILPMDAFARCWVQEFVLFDAIGKALPEELLSTYEALREVWSRRRRAAYNASIQAISDYLTNLAKDKEVIERISVLDQVKYLSKRLELYKTETLRDPISAAQTALSARAADEFCALTDKLIAINKLKGKGVRREILSRVQSDWNIKTSIPATPVAVAGAIGTGAIGGLATDIATSGVSLGLGTLIGSVVGAIGGISIAVTYNFKNGLRNTEVYWSTTSVNNFFIDAILLYLSTAHYGRGRGIWVYNESPSFLRNSIQNIDLTTSITDQYKIKCILNDAISKVFSQIYQININKSQPDEQL